jgi:hypothetical protein
MLFKHPEILYFLALLCIPIIVHLFQLQRFVKTPFTNVAFLQQLALQTRKSSRLKKWLVLSLRMLAFAGLVLAFAQPYFSNQQADTQANYLIFLDNSMSMEAKGAKGKLLNIAAQELFESLPADANISLFTHNQQLLNQDLPSLKEFLLNSKPSASELTYGQIALQFATLTKTLGTSVTPVMISDFQNAPKTDLEQLPAKTVFVQLAPQQKNNISIDSVSIGNDNAQNLRISLHVTNKGTARKQVPVALYDRGRILNKQLFSIDDYAQEIVTFTIPRKRELRLKASIDLLDNFDFDNHYYFNIDSSEKINIMAIGEPAPYLGRVFTQDEFTFTKATANSVDYNLLLKQDFIVLNEINTLPSTLISSLQKFHQQGGTLLVIPGVAVNTDSYQQLFTRLKIGTLRKVQNDSLSIATIHYQHPVFQSVFQKKVSNFQYPKISSWYPTRLNINKPLLSLENQQAFLTQTTANEPHVYWMAAPINPAVSNFTRASLIVPTLYSLGKSSFKLPKLSYVAGVKNSIDIPAKVAPNTVLSIVNASSNFIPLQQRFRNKVRLETEALPNTAGFSYAVKNKDTLKTLAFNYAALESSLTYTDLSAALPAQQQTAIHNSVKEAVLNIRKKNEVHWLWKWFLGVSIVSLLLEIFILKFFKP